MTREQARVIGHIGPTRGGRPEVNTKLHPEGLELFGDIIRERRYDLGLTATQVAAKVGVHYSTIRHWERGSIVSLPRPHHFLKLCAALETTPDWLFAGTEYAGDRPARFDVPERRKAAL